MSIRTKKLGQTGLDITVMGFGAWAIGGEWDYGWGKQNDLDSIATLRAALDKGINWIDTAPAYGLGHSEDVIGTFLKDIPASERPFIFTKCGLPWKNDAWAVYNDISPSSIQKEIDMSLKRLCIDVIDLYQIHWPVPDGEIEAAWETLADLRKAGKVRHIGVSNFSISQLKRVESITHVEVLQPGYSLLSRDIEKEILPWCRKNGTGVICYSPMASGILSGKITRERIDSMADDDWRKAKSDMLKEPRLTRILTLVEVLKEIGNRYSRSAGEVAIAWVLANPNVTAAITGMRHPGQTEITGAANLVLDDMDFKRINGFFEENSVV